MQERDFPEIGRWVSIFDRLMKMYYDRGLSGYEIGWGQQFYVEYLREHPGATSQEMAERFPGGQGDPDQDHQEADGGWIYKSQRR